MLYAHTYICIKPAMVDRKEMFYPIDISDGDDDHEPQKAATSMPNPAITQPVTPNLKVTQPESTLSGG